MRVPKIYVETTIFNFPFADDAPQYRADTLKLFEEIKAGKFEPYTSEYAVGELEDEKNTEKRNKMLALIPEYKIKVLPKKDSIAELAQSYIAARTVPEKYMTDALHIAAAIIEGLDIIVSLNFRHIVKYKTIEIVNVINDLKGYSRIDIHSPAEVIDYD